MAIIKSFSERPAEAKETPYIPLYKKIKIKFVCYRKVLALSQQREKEKYISYNVGTSICEVAVVKLDVVTDARSRICSDIRSVKANL